MVGYSADSEDSEKKLFTQKIRGSPVSGKIVNDKNSEVSTTHGIVVNNGNPIKKSPSKKSRETNDGEPPTPPKSSRSSHDEPSVRPHVRNIKTEKFSSSGSEDAVPDSRNAPKIQEDNSDYDQADDTEKSFSTDVAAEPMKKRRIVVKKEPVSSEDEETIIQRDPDDAIIGPQRKLPVFQNFGAGSDSEAEIQPSQYWLHYHRENEKKEDKKNSPKKSTEIEDSAERKGTGSRRKSPPRITKTEIISTTYKKANKREPKTREDASAAAVDFDDWVDVPKKESNVSRKKSNVKREEKVLQENENSENNRSSGDELNTSRKQAPKSKKESPKKTPASPKPKLSLNSVAKNKKTEKISPAKKKFNESLSKNPAKKRESICDKDTTSEEEEERVVKPVKPATPVQYILALEKIEKTGSSPNGRQRTLVAKVNDKFEGDSEPKVVLQKSQTPKVSLTSVNNASRDSSSDEISSDEEAKPRIQAKVSPTKKHQVSNSLEEESSVRKTPAIQKRETIKSPATATASASLKRKLDSRGASTKNEPASSSSDEDEKREAPPVKRAAPSQKRETIAHTSSSLVSTSMKKKSGAKVSSTDKRSAGRSSSEEGEGRETSATERAAPKSQDQKTIARSSSAGSAFASSKMKFDSKASSIKKKQSTSSSDQEEETEAATPKQKRTKSSSSTGSPSLSLKRKLDSNENTRAGETTKSLNSGAVPLRREKSESNSVEPESSKRAKLTPAAKPPSHTMSDTDDTDSLTRFNTTLNKSITKASIENRSATTVEVKKRGRKETRKSVSINTKHKTKHVPIDTMNQKSILKKTDTSPVEDNTESDQNVENEEELSQEQTAEEEVEPSQEQTDEEKPKPVIPPPKINKRPLNLKELVTRENLTPDNAKASFRLEDLSDDDEIYILDVPRTVDPNELKGQTIRLGGKNKLQIEDQLYETCAKDSADISCVFRTGDDGSSYKTVNIKPAGFISVRQKLSKALQVELKPLEKSNVPFPENLKVRHPLFGAAFKDKIVVANIKVSKRVTESMTKSGAIARTRQDAKPEDKPTKLNNVEKKDKKKRESSEKLIIKSEIESKPKAKVKKAQRPAKEASSDSDSDGGFFRQIKGEVDVDEAEDRKDFRNLSIILDQEDVLSDPDLPTELEETVVLKRPKLSAKKKLGLSADESTLKHKSFDLNSKHSSFFSSTPIKVEKDDKSYRDEIPVNKVRKRKNHSVS